MKNENYYFMLSFLRELWKRLGREHDKVILYGAGKFTQWFMEKVALSMLEGPEVPIIIDDSPAVDDIFQIPVITPPATLEKDQVIFISCSGDNRHEIEKKARKMYPDLRIVNAFAELKSGSISVEGEEAYPFLFTPAISPPYDTVTSLEKQIQRPIVMMEITSFCNFSCEYCFTPQKRGQAKHMDMKVFSRVVEQLTDLNPMFVAFSLGGEPALHPQHMDMIRMVTQQEVELRFFTNGLLLKQEHLKERIVHVISISLRASDLKKRSSKVDFSRYYRNAVAYVKMWNESHLSQSNLAILVLYNPERLPENASWNEKQIEIAPVVRKFLVEAGIRNAFMDPLKHRYALYRKKNGRQLALRVMPVMYSGFYPERDSSVTPATTSNGFCNGPWRILSVTSDGHIGCCNEISNLGVFTKSPDELFEKSLTKIWMTHPNLLKLRKNFLAHKASGICKRCLGGWPNSKKIWDDLDVTWYPDFFPEPTL